MRAIILLSSLLVLVGNVSSRALNSRQSADTIYNCRPGMACWPTDAQWQAFNQTLGGKLQATVPWAKPCFSGLAFGDAYNAAQCTYIENNYADNPVVGVQNNEAGYAREAQYGSAQVGA